MHQSKNSGGLKLALAMAVASLGLSGCDQFQKGFDKGFNEKWEAKTHDDCLQGAMKAGAQAPLAEAYCSCVVKQLDPLPVSQKMSLKLDDPAVKQAETTCAAQAKAAAGP
jgi:hypothetical protein